MGVRQILLLPDMTSNPVREHVTGLDNLDTFVLSRKSDGGRTGNGAREAPWDNSGVLNTALPYVPPVTETPWNADILRFNRYISRKREEILANVTKEGNYSVRKDYHFVTEVNSDYLQLIGLNPNIRTFGLYMSERFLLNGTRIEWPMGRLNADDVIWERTERYRASMELDACKYYLKNKATRPKSVQFSVISTCDNRTSVEDSVIALSHPSSHHLRHEYHRMLRHWESVFLHVIPHARVSGVIGRVANDNVLVSPLTCRRDVTYVNIDHIVEPGWERGKDTAHVDELFVANHDLFFFHWNVEGMARTALYLPFLRSHPKVKVLLPDKTEQKVNAMRMLGIHPSRVVIGHVTARVVYLPQGARCRSVPSVLGLAMLSDAYLEYIHAHLSPAHAPQDVIILIERTGTRGLVQHELVTSFLEGVASKHDLEVIVFSDAILPDLDATLRMFHRAALVVAPHGAGLTNLIYSRAPTVVLELLCPDFSSTFSYMSLARNLGHVYYGMRSSLRGYNDSVECLNIWVDMAAFEDAVNFYINSFILPRRQG